MANTLETFKVAFQAEQSHQFSDRYEGFLTMLGDGTWTTEIYDATTGSFSYPIPPVEDPFEAVKDAEQWVQLWDGSAE